MAIRQQELNDLIKQYGSKENVLVVLELWSTKKHSPVDYVSMFSKAMDGVPGAVLSKELGVSSTRIGQYIQKTVRELKKLSNGSFAGWSPDEVRNSLKELYASLEIESPAVRGRLETRSINTLRRNNCRTVTDIHQLCLAVRSGVKDLPRGVGVHSAAEICELCQQYLAQNRMSCQDCSGLFCMNKKKSKVAIPVRNNVPECPEDITEDTEFNSTSVRKYIGIQAYRAFSFECTQVKDIPMACMLRGAPPQSRDGIGDKIAQRVCNLCDTVLGLECPLKYETHRMSCIEQALQSLRVSMEEYNKQTTGHKVNPVNTCRSLREICGRMFTAALAVLSLIDADVAKRLTSMWLTEEELTRLLEVSFAIGSNIYGDTLTRGITWLYKTNDALHRWYINGCPSDEEKGWYADELLSSIAFKAEGFLDDLDHVFNSL